VIRALLRNRARPLCALLAIALMIPAMPMAAVAAGHISISQGIAGYVTTGEAPGTPVAGATVTVWSTAAVPVVVDTTTSDAEGFYEVELPVGDYYVEFEADGFFGQFYDGVTELAAATEVTVAAGEIDFIELAGQDRYGTAIDISQESHPMGADAVVIARGDDFPDALAGASIAGLHDAPILLTRPQSLPTEVALELLRLDPNEIFILGGTAAVSSGVEAQLAGIVGAGNITRFGGQTRYETAERIAEHLIAELGEGYGGMAFIATGGRFPDALAASPIMAAQGIPLFLAHPTDGLSASTLAAISGSVDEATFIVGGTLAVSDEVEQDLEDLVGEANVERVAGSDRYATAVAVAEFGVSDFGHMWEGVGIATGERFPDALTGGPYQGQLGSVMLLTRIASLPAVTAAALDAHNHHICESVHIYGGVLAINQAVRNEIMAIITPCAVVQGIDAELVPVPVDVAALQLEKEADVDWFVEAGDEIVYTYTLTNIGDLVLEAPFTVDDDMFAAPIDVVATDLAVGADVSVTATYTVTAADVVAGVVTNTATAEGFYNDAAVVSTAAMVSVPLAAPEVTLVKEADVEFFSEVDDEIIFTFTLTNSGNVPLAGPFTIDDPMVMVSADEPGLMVLAPGVFTTFTATYLVTEADLEAGVILNTATAEALFGDVPVVSLEAEVSIPVAVSPALTLAKASDVATFTVAGDQIVYTYTLTNTGNVPLTAPFTVDDDMFVAPIAVVGTDLAVGASLEATATYTVTEDDVIAGFVTNTATAQGFFDGEAVVSATATVTVCTTLADKLAADGRFTTLLAAAEIAGLDGALADPTFGPVTLFAPTDDAFADLRELIGETEWAALLADPEALADVLLYHLLSGKVFSAEVVAGITADEPDPFVVETLLGAYVEFTRLMNGETQYFINDSEIIEFDTEACNGVIHVIDAVLVPVAPAIELVKVPSTESTVTAGDEIVYTYTLANIGSWTLDGPFTVVDSVIGTIIVDPMMWTNLAVGASVEVTASYVVDLNDVVAGSVTNDAYAVGWFDGMEIMSETDTVSIPVAEAVVDTVVVQHVFPHPHHHLTIDARGTLETTPTVAPLEEADVCVQFLNTGDAPVVVDVVLDLDTTLGAQWWYEAEPGVWLDATDGFSLTLDPNVVVEVCFYVFFEHDPGNLAPFDATFNVYATGTTEPVIASTTFEVNLSAPSGP
jgi:putative cell wall-binding protein/uncharacterized surface protein with fasciclin (FAS1) repeats